MWNTGEVYTVELYARVRRAVVVDKMSEREAAKQFGLASQPTEGIYGSTYPWITTWMTLENLKTILR